MGTIIYFAQVTHDSYHGEVNRVLPGTRKERRTNRAPLLTRQAVRDEVYKPGNSTWSIHLPQCRRVPPGGISPSDSSRGNAIRYRLLIAQLTDLAYRHVT